MKITRKFSTDNHGGRRAAFIAAQQLHLDLTALGFRNDRQHPVRGKGYNRRRRVVNKNCAKGRIACIKPNAVDDDLTAGDAIRWIYLYDFPSTTHKNRSSYAAPA